MSAVPNDMEHYMLACSRLKQERDDLATSNSINQDALAWVKSVVIDDDMPAAERMKTLRHHFERGTFPIQLVRRRP